MQTTTNLKALPYNQQPMLAAQIENTCEAQVMKVLLDECVTFRSEIETKMAVSFHCTVDILGRGAPDDLILQHMLENKYDLFVTADHELIARCLAHNLNVAYHKDGQIRLLKLEQVIVRNGVPAVFTTLDKAYLVKPDPKPIIELPKRKTNGAPFKFKVERMPEPKPSLLTRIKKILTSK